MKQLTDEVFAQVQEALRPFAEDAKYIHKDWSDERMRASLTQNTPLTVRHFRKAGEALAALDTAQPVQVNAMLVEALEKCKIALEWVIEQGGGPVCEHEGAVCFCKENNALNFANAALTAAKQAQPVCGYDDETGNCTRVNCCKQAQPERAPLTDAEIEKLREKTFSTNNPFCPVDSKSMRKAVRAAEAAHGIQQGGQQ